MRKLLACIALAITVAPTHAQEFKKHHIGLQANRLLDQIISLGDNSPVNNPYLLRYSFQLNQNQALTAGFGFLLDNIDEKEGGETNFSELNFRAGYMYNFPLSTRFTLGLGADAVIQRNVSNSIITSERGSPFADSTVFKSERLDNAVGAGLRLNLTFNITDYLALGTEANYYFLSGLEKTTISTTRFDPADEIQNFNSNTEERTTSSFSIQAPVAIFLILRL